MMSHIKVCFAMIIQYDVTSTAIGKSYLKNSASNLIIESTADLLLPSSLFSSAIPLHLVVRAPVPQNGN
uniref:Uncharacterized protein n=1 Tax=Anguilla anguilla TaxID=7936 RepID=A0A0E9P8X4_ANGAN